MNATTLLSDTDENPVPQTLDELLAAQRLHDVLPPALFAELRGMMHHVVIKPGEVLIRQADRGDDLFLMLRGMLGVRVEHADGTSTDVDEIRPGGVVGEMALLTGQPRTATVFAMEASDLARLTRVEFEHLAAEYPEPMHAFLRRTLPRLRRTQVVRLLTELSVISDEEGAARDRKQPRVEHLPSGEVVPGRRCRGSCLHRGERPPTGHHDRPRRP
jgi:CRP-like cAMP-binding protein